LEIKIKGGQKRFSFIVIPFPHSGILYLFEYAGSITNYGFTRKKVELISDFGFRISDLKI
jgi:hypothetical protein